MARRNLTYLAPLAPLLLIVLLAGCSDKPEALVASAKTLLAKNDINAAVIQLKNALQQNPDLAEARFLLGKAELATGQFDGAKRDLRIALELKHPPDAVIPPLAEAMLGSGEFKKVIDEFGKIGAKAPEAPADLPAPLAQAMKQLGVTRKGTDKSEKVVSVTTPAALAELQTTVGRAYLALGNAEAGKAAYAAALAARPNYAPALLGQARLAAGAGDLPGALALLQTALATSPGLAEAWELQGYIQQAQGQQDVALASFRKALDAKRDYLPAHSAVVLLLADQGKLEEATEQLNAMRKVAPKDLQTLYLQAQLAHRRKDFAAARESIQQVLAVAPENLNALLLAGAVDFELKSYTQAEGNLIKVLKAAPGQPFARRLLVGTYLRTGRADKALEALKPVLDKIGDRSDLLTLAGEVYMQNGNAAEASRYFEKAANLDPKNNGRKTTLALARIAQGDTRQALGELEQAIGEDTTTRSDLALIALHIRQREYAKALAAIDALEKKDPANPLSSVLRGAILQNTNDIPGARKSFERALAIDPGYFPAAERLAQLDLADNRPDDARKRMDAVLAKDPKQTQALLAIAALRAKAGAPADEVATLIGKAIAANPGDVTSRLTLMVHYLRSKDPKKAVAAGQDALAAIPDRPEILEALGQAQQAAGDSNQAIATYSRWARLQPSSPFALLRLAEAQTAAKDTNAALQTLRKALEMKPDLVEAQRWIIALDLSAGRMQQALATAREVQKQRPTEAVGFLLEGDIHASKNAWVPAAAAYRVGLKLDRSTALAMRLHGAVLAGGNTVDAEKFAVSWLKDFPKDKPFRFYVANSALVRKDFVTANRYYRGLLDLDPNDAVILNNLAWSAGQIKDPKALEYAEKANQLAPSEPAIMDTLAMLLIEKGDAARGVEILRKASGLAPNEPALRLKLAQGLIKIDQKDAAKKELEELTKLGDAFPAQAEVKRLIQGL